MRPHMPQSFVGFFLKISKVGAAKGLWPPLPHY